MRPRFVGHINRRAFAEWENGDAKVAGEDFWRMATETDVKGVAVVKIVGDKLAVQHHAGDIAGVMKAKDGISAEVNAFREFDAPDRRFFKVRIQRRGRHRLLNLARGNFPQRPGDLHVFEGGFEFDRSRGMWTKALENAVGFAREIAAV